MSIHDTIGGAEAFESSQYFQPGQYIVSIKQCKYVEGYKGQSFVIECKVLHTVSTDAKAPMPGAVAAQVIKVSGDDMKKQMGLSNWKGFLGSVLGSDADNLTDQEWAQISSSAVEENQLAGQVIKLDCYMKETKAGNPFTVHKWLGKATDADLQAAGVAA